MLHLKIKPKGSQEMNRSCKKTWFSGRKPLNINLGNLGLFFVVNLFNFTDSIPWDETHDETHHHFRFHLFQVTTFWATNPCANSGNVVGLMIVSPRFSMAEVGAAPGATLKGRHAAGRPSPMPGPGRKWWGGAGAMGKEFGEDQGEWLCLFFLYVCKSESCWGLWTVFCV